MWAASILCNCSAQYCDRKPNHSTVAGQTHCDTVYQTPGLSLPSGLAFETWPTQSAQCATHIIESIIHNFARCWSKRCKVHTLKCTTFLRKKNSTSNETAIKKIMWKTSIRQKWVVDPGDGCRALWKAYRFGLQSLERMWDADEESTSKRLLQRTALWERPRCRASSSSVSIRKAQRTTGRKELFVINFLNFSYARLAC